VFDLAVQKSGAGAYRTAGLVTTPIDAKRYFNNALASKL